MYLKQADIFWGTSKDFIRDTMKLAMKKNFPVGAILFQEGDPANQFYIHLKGHIKLRIGEAGQTVYTINRAGEAFGWSSLIGRDIYSASAECLKPTTLLIIDREELQPILNRYPEDGMIFFRQLAETLGTRLLQSYKMITSSLAVAGQSVYGSGQIQEPVAQ